RRHTRCLSDWSSDVCSSDLVLGVIFLELKGFAAGAGEGVNEAGKSRGVAAELFIECARAELAQGFEDVQSAKLEGGVIDLCGVQIGRAPCRVRVGGGGWHVG